MIIDTDKIIRWIPEHLAAIGHTIGGEVHNHLVDFAHFLEGKQAEEDAILLLRGKGYAINPPPQPAP